MNNKLKYLPLAIAIALTGCGGSDSNKAPEFTGSMAYTLQEDTQLTGQVIAQDDDTLTYTVASAASNGSFSLDENGNFTYTPNENYFGEDSVTVAASDGSSSTEAVINFTINNVNDAPTLTNQSITVTTSSITEGTLTFSDVDGDNVTVNVVTPPANGELALDSQTGDFSYTAQSLTEIDDTFVITYTDGIIDEPITATISLKPSYITNEDKLSYYYSSPKSHLKQAEAIAAKINDDIYLDTINAQLAKSYYTAGFIDKADQLYSSISRLDSLANAYRETAGTLNKLSLIDEAAEFRNKAVTAYNQYIAEKGLDNISSSDPTFFINLANDFNEAGQYEDAADLYKALELYANQVREEEYTTTYGRFITAFRNATQSAVDLYQTEPNTTNLALATQVVKTYAGLLENTGYQYQKKGEYKGQPINRLKLTFITGVINFAMQLNDTEMAKYYINYALSLYGHSGFDSNYLFDASPYGEATLAVYQNPLQDLSAYIGFLYKIPLNDNPAYNLISEKDDQADAVANTQAYEIVTALNTGYTMEDAIAEAKNYFLEQDEANYTDLYLALADGYSEPGAAMIAYNSGQPEIALALLKKAKEYMFTAQFWDEQVKTQSNRLVGAQGCTKHLNLEMIVGSQEQAQETAQQCLNWFEENANSLSTRVVIDGYSDLIRAFQITGLDNEITPLITKQKTQLDRLEKPQDKVTMLLEYLGYLIETDHVDIAYSWALEAINLVRSNISAYDADKLDVTLKHLYNSLLSPEEVGRNYFTRDSFITSLSKYQSNSEQYADIYADLNNQLLTLVSFSKDFVLTQTNKVIQENMEGFVSLFTLLNATDLTAELIEHDVNGEADKLALYALQASLIANKDDFPGQHIASVDTDHDGKPNFFLSTATQQSIEESGLIADDDADNDGILDENDPTPLGE